MKKTEQKKKEKDFGLYLLVVVSLLCIFALGWLVGFHSAEDATNKKWEIKNAVADCERQGKAAVRGAEHDDDIVCVVKSATESSATESDVVFKNNIYYSTDGSGRVQTIYVYDQKTGRWIQRQ